MQQVKDKDTQSGSGSASADKGTASADGLRGGSMNTVPSSANASASTSPAAVAALMPAHDTDHDSGYGSSGSSGSGRDRARYAAVVAAMGNLGSDGGSASFDSRIGEICHGRSGSVESENSSAGGVFSLSWPGGDYVASGSGGGDVNAALELGQPVQARLQQPQQQQQPAAFKYPMVLEGLNFS